MKELQIINHTYIIPTYGNKHHINAYGKIEYISSRGIKRVIYYEIGKIKNGYEVVNCGSLWYPDLKLYKH